MRLVYVNSLKEGMCLGKTIYDPSGTDLLKKGVTLKPNLINAIHRLGINAIYIDDDISSGIELPPVVGERIRNKVVQDVKAFFTSTGHRDDLAKRNRFVEGMGNIVDDILSEALSDENFSVQLQDFKSFDDPLFNHAVNVCILSIAIGTELNLPKRELVHLSKGAILHDFGKMFVDQNLLNKPEKLTALELYEVQEYVKKGHDFIRSAISPSKEVLLCILQHQEKINGSGYPHHKSGDQIGLLAQIVAISDVFDAMTSKRPYRAPLSPAEAAEYIMGNVGYQFDYPVVDAFLKRVTVYPLGAHVKLNTGEIGIVSELKKGYLLRPKIRVVSNTNDIKEIDLSHKDNLHLVIEKLFS